jgi:hypothetical protein
MNQQFISLISISMANKNLTTLMIQDVSTPLNAN